MGPRLVMGLLLVGACEQGGAPQPEAATSASASAAMVVSTGAASPAPAPTVAHSRSPFAGSWSGVCQVVRAKVSVPRGVSDRTWRSDDGSRATGEGRLTLEVGADGQLSGQGQGALGALRLRGAVQRGTLRAGLVPADPEARPTMRGTLLGEGRGDHFELTLRASNEDATLARRCALDLRRR